MGADDNSKTKLDAIVKSHDGDDEVKSSRSKARES
jgi:hypothetical protein